MGVGHSEAIIITTFSFLLCSIIWPGTWSRTTEAYIDTHGRARSFCFTLKNHPSNAWMRPDLKAASVGNNEKEQKDGERETGLEEIGPAARSSLSFSLSLSLSLSFSSVFVSDCIRHAKQLTRNNSSKNEEKNSDFQSFKNKRLDGFPSFNASHIPLYDTLIISLIFHLPFGNDR